MNHDQGAKFPFPFHFVSELVDDVPPYNPARGSGDLISPEQISGTFRGNGWWVTPLRATRVRFDNLISPAQHLHAGMHQAGD